MANGGDAIDASQQQIENQKKNEQAKQALSPYDALAREVDYFQSLETSLNLKSSEAQQHLGRGKQEIVQILLKIAQEGADIAEHPDQKTGGNEIGALAGSLATTLHEYRGDLENFSAIAGIEEEDQKLDQGENATDILKSKKELLLKLPPNPKAAAPYKEKIAKKILESVTALTTYLKDEATFKVTSEKVENWSKLVDVYRKKPDEANFKAVKEKRVDLKKAGDELFNGKIDQPSSPTAKFYQKLWNDQYQPLEKRQAELQQQVDDREKEVIEMQSIIVLASAEQSWAAVIQPKINQYTQDSEKDPALETSLLSDLLKTKALIGPFTVAENQGKMNFDVFTKLSERMKTVGENITMIEKKRETRKLNKNLIEKDFAQYVHFEPTGKDLYTFTPEFEKLPEEIKILIRFQVESMAQKQHEQVQKETFNATLEFMNPEEKMKQLAEIMGAKGKPYFDGLEKLKQKDAEGAVDCFQRYLSQPLSPDETQMYQETLADAREKIEAIYIQKLNVVDDLFSDVKSLKYAGRKLAGSAELTPEEGNEADAIEAEIGTFRKEILDGKVKNFEERLAELQKAVRGKLAEKKTAETNILKMTSDLYELSKEKDPVKRKKGFFEFAKTARDGYAYSIAQKYLDYALEDDFAKAAEKVPREDVLKKLLADKEFLKKLKQETKVSHEKMIQTNPGLKGVLTEEMVEKQLLNRELEAKYKLEVRRAMTPTDAQVENVYGQDFVNGEKTDPVLDAYNNWFPVDKPDWYKPWNYGAEEWDQFGVDCIKFVFEQLPMLGIGSLAGAAGKLGAKAGGKLVLKYLLKTGLKEAEMAIIEEGGLKALQLSLKSGKALSYGAARLAGSVAAEGATMYVAGIPLEYLKTGHVADFEAKSPGKSISEHLLESMVKVSFFKGVGLLEHLPGLSQLAQQGGAKATMAWLARETMSGGAGAGLDYALAKMQGRDMSGQEIFQSMVSNYLISLGMGAVHGSGNAEKTARELNEPLIKERMSEAGVDFSKPETLRSARILGDGKIIVNGKIIPDITVAKLQFMPEVVRLRLQDLASKNAINTHHRSQFSDQVPQELWPKTKTHPDGDPEAGKKIPAWIGTDGKVYYNIDRLNKIAHGESDGPYRSNPNEKMLPEGWAIHADANGNLVIVNERGEISSYSKFIKTPEGKRFKELLEELKNHEVTHRLVEKANINSNGQLSKELLALADANPEIKAALEKNGHALNKDGIQELLCEIADGKVHIGEEARGPLEAHISAETKAALETAVRKYIPDFSFKNVRKIDTKTLAKGKSTDFTREHSAAKDGGAEVVDSIRVPKAPTEAELAYKKIIDRLDLILDRQPPSVKTDKKAFEARKNEVLSTLLKIGKEAQLKAKSSTPYEKVDPKLMEKLVFGGIFNSKDAIELGKALKDKYDSEYHTQYQKEYYGLSKRLSEAIEKGTLLDFDKSLNFIEREFVKEIQEEAKEVNRLISTSERNVDPEGRPSSFPKDPAKIQQDIATLKDALLQGRIKLNDINLKMLATSANGRQVIHDLTSDTHTPDSVRVRAGKFHDQFETQKIVPDVLKNHGKNLTPGMRKAIEVGDIGRLEANILAKDQRKLLTPSQLEIILHKIDITDDTLKILEANIDHPQLTPELIEKIMKGAPEKIALNAEFSGGKTEISMYEVGILGEGGTAVVYKIAYLDGENRLQFVACKKPHPKVDAGITGHAMSKEVETAKMMLQLYKNGLRTNNLMKYHFVSADGKMVFTEIYAYKTPDGTVIKKDIDGLAESPETDPELLYRGVLGGGRGLAALEERGFIQTDFKLANVLPANGIDGQTGVQIDLGTLVKKEDFAGRAKWETPMLEGKYTAGQMPEGLGMTGGYYSEPLYNKLNELIPNSKIFPPLPEHNIPSHLHVSLPVEKHHTYTFGVALKALLKGKITWDVLVKDEKGKMTPGKEDLDVYPEHLLPTPPYPADANKKLEALADECMDLNQHTPMAEVNYRLEQILNSKH